MEATNQEDGSVRRVSTATLRVLRPLAFLCLLVSAVFLACQAGSIHYRETGWPPVLRTSEARVQALIKDRVGNVDAARAYWDSELARRVDPSRSPIPDLDGVRSLGGALDLLSGRKAFALSLRDGGSQGVANARLRARPVWQQERLIEAELTGLARTAREAGIAPPELVLADPAILRRARQSERLYGRAISEFDRWFVDPAGRSLRLDAFPGWTGRVEDAVLLHASVSPDTRDPAERRLAGLLRGTGDPGVRAGGRMLYAGHQAGLLTAGLVEGASERELMEMAQGANRLRLRLGAGPALRVMPAVRSAQDVEHLVLLSNLLGPDTLAVVELFGDDAAYLLEAMSTPAAPGWSVRMRLALAATCGLLALLLVVSAPLGAALRRTHGSAGAG